ncbi:hypothetical protein MU1_57710 [Paenibacillus glycanilyticus]|uniref:Uncharacterized protein n=1 Tax=Paenibacillus glycanilyticus TaxID=126569 RepID=A0ABQ6GP72_9BACL|nr:hypothetical protein MU1_57710 [Paenibacillus glycanilyticus]
MSHLRRERTLPLRNGILKIVIPPKMSLLISAGSAAFTVSVVNNDH